MVRVRSAAVYEIDGRLLIRTVHYCGGAGVQDPRTDLLDGYPDLAPDELGGVVMAALARCREVGMPSSWPPLREYAQGFLKVSPVRYRSFRAWQRAARYVLVSAYAGAVEVSRWWPDLGRGGWEPWPASPRVGGWTYEALLPSDADPAEIGTGILAVLRHPPWRDTYVNQ